MTSYPSTEALKRMRANRTPEEQYVDDLVREVTFLVNLIFKDLIAGGKPDYLYTIDRYGSDCFAERDDGLVSIDSDCALKLRATLNHNQVLETCASNLAHELMHLYDKESTHPPWRVNGNGESHTSEGWCWMVAHFERAASEIDVNYERLHRAAQFAERYSNLFSREGFAHDGMPNILFLLTNYSPGLTASPHLGAAQSNILTFVEQAEQLQKQQELECNELRLSITDDQSVVVEELFATVERLKELLKKPLPPSNN